MLPNAKRRQQQGDVHIAVGPFVLGAVGAEQIDRLRIGILAQHGLNDLAPLLHTLISMTFMVSVPKMSTSVTATLRRPGSAHPGQT